MNLTSADKPADQWKAIAGRSPRKPVAEARIIPTAGWSAVETNTPIVAHIIDVLQNPEVNSLRIF